MLLTHLSPAQITFSSNSRKEAFASLENKKSSVQFGAAPVQDANVKFSGKKAKVGFFGGILGIVLASAFDPTLATDAGKVTIISSILSAFSGAWWQGAEKFG